MRRWKVRAVLSIVACCLAPITSQAAIVITGTRVIYPEKSREVDVRLSNVGKTPVLVQSWIDDGHAEASPDEIKVPFVLMPAVFRVDPNKGQTLRVMYTGDALPEDRESVYWFNVLEIPPKPTTAEDQNLMQLAFRTRIKLFYRPAALENSGPEQAREQLAWKVIRDDKGGSVLRVDNRSPYYMTLSTVTAKVGGKDVQFDSAMVAPFGHQEFVAKSDADKLVAPAAISYELLNDYGAGVKGTATAQ
ncbi:fimbria/pilus periplasmic chaperone [Burkholderia ubonensis]|uniref:fimbria/pilus periplasmic chaperone n=1 Tax=Burkholderia ubonensis TaxID=101571 RepID=UPI0007543253|nr:fimbria/pilus periplasmic chaperone [Burkholderia ubonensis]KVN74702.1 pilus assembly protein [Burkholderia ubonensis]